mmetsp:Transcript_29718/g.71824  ORF Transcript_29718/g.71824 Transcript_29718/m.71824 type:complete len:471 (+) Transcript_29718:237-1649(+)
MCLLTKIYHKMAQPAFDIPYTILLVIAESILTALVVLRVPYTEIDWVAYMQEVTTYQEGERDYINIRGDTGPLVYPAGFLYLYGWLKSLAVGDSDSTNSGADILGLDGSTSAESIKRIQWIFVFLYLFNSVIVLALYRTVTQRARQNQEKMQQLSSTSMIVWYWRIAMGLTCLSKRVHSIFVLRLFNDAPAMVLLHLSMYLFACCDAWAMGCVVFSLAVSIKMNVLLFAPGLLLLLIQKNQSLFGTMKHLSICALVQLVLGWPFLSTYPISYIKKAFEFDRVFFFKWSVNWKFIPEWLFVSKPWALLLLVCHLGSLSFLASKWWKTSISQRGRAKTRESLRWSKNNPNNTNVHLSPEYIIYTMFVSNFIGIAFARTLHYQFYCWYFYSLPMLHWMTADESASSKNGMVWVALNLISSVIAIISVEYAFNVFPATELSSMLLQLSHLYLLMKIFWSVVPSIIVEEYEKRSQ